MRNLIVSYSFTGNNDALAAELATILTAKHVRLMDSKTRKVGSIVADVLFKRTPMTEWEDLAIEEYDRVLFVGPIWMGLVATPFRPFFRRCAGRIGSYCWVSISGGALGPNPKIAEELERRLTTPPASVLDMHIADLVPRELKTDRKTTASYRISNDDKRILVESVVSSLSTDISCEDLGA